MEEKKHEFVCDGIADDKTQARLAAERVIAAMMVEGGVPREELKISYEPFGGWQVAWKVTRTKTTTDTDTK